MYGGLKNLRTCSAAHIFGKNGNFYTELTKMSIFLAFFCKMITLFYYGKLEYWVKNGLF